MLKNAATLALGVSVAVVACRPTGGIAVQDDAAAASAPVAKAAPPEPVETPFDKIGKLKTFDEALNNVNAITADLKVIVAGIRQGKGTVGALLVDPSVYEDMKLVLGNVERNDVLRALVRYSIKQDEKKPAVSIGKAP